MVTTRPIYSCPLYLHSTSSPKHRQQEHAAPTERLNTKQVIREATKVPRAKETGDNLEAKAEEVQEEITMREDEDDDQPVGADVEDTDRGPGIETEKNARGRKMAFKERGSLVSHVHEDRDLPSNSRRRKVAASLRRVHTDSHITTLQRVMVQAGMNDDTAHDHILSSEYSSLLALEFNRNPIVDDEAAFDIHPPPVTQDKSKLALRPPVVTIMGHVDHGKTTLLDTLRSASVAKGEAGGITQHIGAFSVPVKGEVDRSITFLDTPGHAAFTAMRARGAGVTDVVVLVVAADDGIMPQTREVLDLVRKDDNVKLIVAINKIDKLGADPEKVERALLAEDVQLESFDGDIPCVHVSGLTGKGLDQLVETISLVAEMQDLRAEKEGPVQGYVLESRMQKGLGPVATVLLLRGSMSPGNHLICGNTWAKIRRLTSPAGSTVKTVYPGEAVVVSGWKEVPGAGDEVLNGTESAVKKALANRIRKTETEATLQDVDAINNSRREERGRREEEVAQAKLARRGQRGGRVQAGTAGVKEEEEKDVLKELRVVVKGDVSGSVEAVAGAIQGIGNHLAHVKIVATGVGEVTESDVMRAKAAEGMIVAFSVKAPNAIESMAVGQGVSILSSSIIYHLMDEVKERVIKLLPGTFERRVRGEATVLEIFDIHLKAQKIMKVAGCRVSNGVIEKSKHARVVRNGERVFEGRLDTFRHLKKDITEAGKGMECGMSLENFSDLQVGDMIQMYDEVEIPGRL
ncbi:hypothetical protein EUX98_g4544 [Antrodiella citrinella]|uniref:Tr-type G domain-containing protein n=1 Tax=Antrodiella citrinella TaxID=2447956 RepID=A0A4V3XIL1_9APHY|nr:hypothetical protein EUX98_g4544 [Antrodiella citrinella]